MSTPPTETPFIGRDKEIRQVLAVLEEQIENENPIILIHGKRGVGKSAFVEYGVIPRLVGDATGWTAVGITPLHNPKGIIASLSEAIVTLVNAAQPSEGNSLWLELALRKIETINKEKPESALEVILAATKEFRERTTAEKRLILVDQVEEILSEGVSDTDRARFLGALVELAKTEFGYIILVHRGTVNDLTSAVPSLPKIPSFELGSPTKEEMRQIIEAHIASDPEAKQPASKTIATVLCDALESHQEALAFLPQTLREMVDSDRLGDHLRKDFHDAIRRHQGESAPVEKRKHGATKWGEETLDVRMALDLVVRRLIEIDRRGVQVRPARPIGQVATTESEKHVLKTLTATSVVSEQEGKVKLTDEEFLDTWWKVSQINADETAQQREWISEMLASMERKWNRAEKHASMLLPYGDFLDHASQLTQKRQAWGYGSEEFVRASVDRGKAFSQRMESDEETAEIPPHLLGKEPKKKEAKVEKSEFLGRKKNKWNSERVGLVVLGTGLVIMIALFVYLISDSWTNPERQKSPAKKHPSEMKGTHGGLILPQD